MGAESALNCPVVPARSDCRTESRILPKCEKCRHSSDRGVRNALFLPLLALQRFQILFHTRSAGKLDVLLHIMHHLLGTLAVISCYPSAKVKDEQQQLMVHQMTLANVQHRQDLHFGISGTALTTTTHALLVPAGAIALDMFGRHLYKS